MICYLTTASANPAAASDVLAFLSADEYLNHERRWVRWLVAAPPGLIRDSRGVC